MSTPATIPCLLYFAALFLTVATLWILLYADPNEASSPQNFFVSIVVVMPFVMLIYFGLVVRPVKVSVENRWNSGGKHGEEFKISMAWYLI